MKILLDLQNSIRAVTLNSEFSLCGLIIIIRIFVSEGADITESKLHKILNFFLLKTYSLSTITCIMGGRIPFYHPSTRNLYYY